MRFSVVIPVYNRPEELNELLESLTHQTFKSFEVVVVEDGSETSSSEVAARYAHSLPLRYVVQENAGPGAARNKGVAAAQGEFVVILDSDVLLKADYLEVVDRELKAHPEVDAYGGPDEAHPSFTNLQKAIDYAMTSVLTTGGIRGKGEQMDRFYPRSFNMGVRRTVYEAVGGFSGMRFGEDIDFSLRLVKQGYRTALFKRAAVFHKRRTGLRAFFKQVFNSGVARIVLWRRHPGSLKAVHMLPSCFCVGVAGCLLLAVWHPAFLLLPLVYAVAVWLDALRSTASWAVPALAVVTSFVQLIGYGAGFLKGLFMHAVMRREPTAGFTRNFYK